MKLECECTANDYWGCFQELHLAEEDWWYIEDTFGGPLRMRLNANIMITAHPDSGWPGGVTWPFPGHPGLWLTVVPNWDQIYPQIHVDGPWHEDYRRARRQAGFEE